MITWLISVSDGRSNTTQTSDNSQT